MCKRGLIIIRFFKLERLKLKAVNIITANVMNVYTVSKRIQTLVLYIDSQDEIIIITVIYHLWRTVNGRSHYRGTHSLHASINELYSTQIRTR